MSVAPCCSIDAASSLSSMPAPASGVGVVLGGLKQIALNGRRGVCAGQTKDQVLCGRVGVQLDRGELISVRLQSVKPMFATELCKDGKGVGVFARMTIQAGSILVLEPPVLVAHGARGYQNLAEQYVLLPDDVQRLVDVLHRCDWNDHPSITDDPTHGLHSIVYSVIVRSMRNDTRLSKLDSILQRIMLVNAIPMAELALSEMEMGLFLSASRFNHSCSPNAAYEFLNSEGRLKVQALCEIKAGEEICVSYLDREYLLQVRKHRQHILMPKLSGNVCQCLACLDIDSDERRCNIAEAEKQIQQAMDRQDDSSEVGLSNVEEKLRLLDEEHLYNRGDTMYDAFLISSQSNRQSDMQKWAQRAHAYYAKLFGEDDEDARLMRQFAQCPPISEAECLDRIKAFR